MFYFGDRISRIYQNYQDFENGFHLFEMAANAELKANSPTTVNPNKTHLA